MNPAKEPASDRTAGGPPAIAAAIEDALKPLGVTIDSLPLPPSRLRALIREARGRAA